MAKVYHLSSWRKDEIEEYELIKITPKTVTVQGQHRVERSARWSQWGQWYETLEEAKAARIKRIQADAIKAERDLANAQVELATPPKIIPITKVDRPPDHTRIRLR